VADALLSHTPNFDGPVGRRPVFAMSRGSDSVLIGRSHGELGGFAASRFRPQSYIYT